MKLFTLEIVTPSKLAYTAEVGSVTVPGSLGEFQVLFNHAPIVSNFDIGKIKVQTQENEAFYFATGGGVIEVLANKVVVLAASVERADEIDTGRAESAVERAKRRLESKDNVCLVRH